MIKLEPCPGCGRTLMTHPVGGPVIRTDVAPLEADEATRALLGGRELYRVTFLGGRPANFGSAGPDVLAKLRTEPGERPFVVQGHRCTRTAQEALSRPRSPSADKETGPAPKGRPAVPGAPSPARSTERSSVRSADRPPFEIDWSKVGEDAEPRCPDCGLLMEDGEYVSAQLGEIYVWAVHLTGCRRP